MEKKKFYQVTKEINGITYVAQFNGLSCALKAVDQSYIDDSKNISTLEFANYIFDNVIVEPSNLSVDDFETMEEFQEVVKFGREVMQGKFRDKAANKGTDKK